MADIIEKLMQIVLSIPEMMDKALDEIRGQIYGVNTRIGGIDGKIRALESRTIGAPTTGSAPGAPPGPPGPPPPPGAPPAPPRPGAPARPANPISLRSSIMGELKDLFKKRRAISDGG